MRGVQCCNVCDPTTTYCVIHSLHLTGQFSNYSCIYSSYINSTDSASPFFTPRQCVQGTTTPPPQWRRYSKTCNVFFFRTVYKTVKSDYKLRHVCLAVCLAVCLSDRPFVCLSVRPSLPSSAWKTRIPVDGFSLNLI
jgi:hypothetical protein